MTKSAKKLIEVALPLDAINAASAREKSIRHGHPSMLHLWWARRPLAAARAVIFAQMVDDPSARPDLFPTDKAQEKERQRLFHILEELVKWENTTNDELLQKAREEIWESWRRACAENADHPKARELFDRNRLPAFHDPFAGGGALPLEAQRLGMESYASDLNPVAVLINKAMVEIPPRFAGQPPCNPEARGEQTLIQRTWKGAEGLAEDVQYYGKWMRDEAEKRVGHLYPKVRITAEMAVDRPDLKDYVGRELTVIAWVWARTVASPNPAFGDVRVPLASTFLLATKKGKQAYIEPIVGASGYRFKVRTGAPANVEAVNSGTKLGRGANFKCVMSGMPMESAHIYSEAKAGRMGARLMAVVLEGDRTRVYVDPTDDMEEIARSASCEWRPEMTMPENPRWFSPPLYGLTTYGDIYTDRQLVALKTFSDLVAEARREAEEAAKACGLADDGVRLRDGGAGAQAYGDAVSVYLGFVVDRLANYSSAVCTWHHGVKYETVTSTFGRQAIPMSWDFAEGNPFSSSSGSWTNGLDWSIRPLATLGSGACGVVEQADATSQSISEGKVVSTDPPYYDNIGYADLSDFFYIWLRASLKDTYPDLFATLAVPKVDELVATPYRHGGVTEAEEFFLAGMTQAMSQVGLQAHPSFPVTIYYAFRQSESHGEGGTASTGWETFLEAVIAAGLSVVGTWPVRTEYTGNLKKQVSALSSSIVLVCRPRDPDARSVFRRDFRAALARELPLALAHLQRSNTAPVDLAQAAIGPGMAVFTRYREVRDLEGSTLSVRDALALINEVLDECLAEQEGDFDADTRWALAWYEQVGFGEAEFGVADTLSKAKNTSVGGLVEAGIIVSKAGKVRLLRATELPDRWDPGSDARRSAWEMVHHLARRLTEGGESAASDLARELGSKAEVARELAYRLYSLAERKKRAQDALGYNALVQSWPEVVRLAREDRPETNEEQTVLFDSEED